MDGGINGSGKDKKDRADYVFVLDLPESSVVFVDTNRSRSVLHFGGGEAVPLGEVTYHGPADNVAEFQKFLSQDSILAKAWPLYKRYGEDVKYVFVYMDSVNYQRKLDLKQAGACSRDVPAVVSNVFPLDANIGGGACGLDKKVLVMLTSDGNVPGCSGDFEQCIFHGDIDRVKSDFVCKQEQWTKHLLDLRNLGNYAYPYNGDVYNGLYFLLYEAPPKYANLVMAGLVAGAAIVMTALLCVVILVAPFYFILFIFFGIPFKLWPNSIRNTCSRGRIWQQKMRWIEIEILVFWVGIHFFTDDFCPLEWIGLDSKTNLPKSTKQLLLRRSEPESITPPAYMRAAHNTNDHIV